ncbi:MAG: hypothetical protein OXU81_03250 [Gammaproteobacteria bacterium]|nr:hypothetical protein [Gammaproteobacteria bacterium]
MSAARTKAQQRALMATDSEWAQIGEAAAAAGMEKSRYVIHRTLAPESLPPEVMRRAIRQSLVLAVLEERRHRATGARDEWDAACAAVDAWLEREGELAHLTDPGAANRWKALGRPDMGEDEPS